MNTITIKNITIAYVLIRNGIRVVYIIMYKNIHRCNMNYCFINSLLNLSEHCFTLTVSKINSLGLK